MERRRDRWWRRRLRATPWASAASYCSIVSIFLAALVFAPLGVLLGLVAAFKKQVALGVIGIIIGVISLLLSPSFQLLLVGMGLRMGMR